MGSPLWHRDTYSASLGQRCHLLFLGDGAATIWGRKKNRHRRDGSDANAQQPRESLVDFMCCSNIIIYSKNRKTTFLTGSRSEVLNIALSTSQLKFFIDNWLISAELSSSDHIYVKFDTDGKYWLNSEYIQAKVETIISKSA